MDAERLAAALGRPVVGLRAVGGGSICASYRVDLAGGGRAFAKTLDGAPADFFAAEAHGLERLAAAGAPVPAVLAVTEDLLVLEWVDSGAPSARAAEALGRALAAAHSHRPECFGGLDHGAGYIGPLPLPGGPYDSWAALWAEGRVRPYLREAVDGGAVDSSDARDVERVLDLLDELPGATEPPALVHGDLWSGNVLWAVDGTPRLVDAAAVHGGHREADLAMLELFGLPHLAALVRGYEEAATPPLPDGWRDRVAVHQLHPVLVHAVLFGAGYGARAGALARAALRTF